MKRTAGTAGSCPSASAACTRFRSHRYTLEISIRALLVATVLFTPGPVFARDFPANATPSETIPVSSEQNASATVAALPTDPFSLTLEALHSQGLRRHSRSLKQSSCPNAGTASSLYVHQHDHDLASSELASWHGFYVGACLSQHFRFVSMCRISKQHM